MTPRNDEQCNLFLDRIISERRTHRRFNQEMPSDDMVKDIIHAGLQAPFAAASVGDSEDYFRRFFVIRRDSKAMTALIPLVFREVLKNAADLEAAVVTNERLQVQAAGFVKRLAMIKKMGIVPGVGTAPFFIVTAERKGFPPVEQQSLAHCMENMWLKATALGLGFQLVSITSQMADDEEFRRIIGLRSGQWALMGCAIGYPADELSPSTRPAVEEVTTWVQ